MQCNEFMELLPGYLDGELDLMQSVEVEKHLETCETCLQTIESQRVLQSAMRTGALYHEPRAPLERKILRAVQKQERATVSRPLFGARQVQFAAACAALLLLAVWGTGRLRPTPSDSDLIANEALSGHLRSLMANHLTDVVSSDKHTVKPWFNSKVDYSPPVIDMAAQGFPLAGGRLDYLDNQPVTALVYRRQKHVINLFVWPATAPNTAPAFLSRRGYNMIHWTQSGFACWAVSDLNTAELRDFAQHYQAQIALSSHP